LGFTGVFDEWLANYSVRVQGLVDSHMRQKVSNPYHSLTIDEIIRHTFVRVEEGLLWGLRVDYEIKEQAVIVLTGKALYR
jgi:hypothetical protein